MHPTNINNIKGKNDLKLMHPTNINNIKGKND